jgi:hypothetical protein
MRPGRSNYSNGFVTSGRSKTASIIGGIEPRMRIVAPLAKPTRPVCSGCSAHWRSFCTNNNGQSQGPQIVAGLRAPRLSTTLGHDPPIHVSSLIIFGINPHRPTCILICGPDSFCPYRPRSPENPNPLPLAIHSFADCCSAPQRPSDFGNGRAPRMELRRRAQKLRCAQRTKGVDYAS